MAQLQRSRRGYPVNFVAQPQEEIPVNCSICFDVVSDPKMVSCCKHSFCADCIGRIEREKKPCPFCNQKFTLSDDIRLVGILNSLKVYCPHRERGCEWKGELGDIQSHLNKEPTLDKLLKGCQFQEIQCGFCQSHSCERRLMTDHISTQCLNRDIECEYHYAGCDFKKPQQQLEFHVREEVSLHLSLVANHVQGSLSQRDNEIEELKEELNRQREQIQELKQQYTDLQRLSEEELKTFREELSWRERHTSRNWMTLLLLSALMLTGGIVFAYLYPTDLPIDMNKNDLNVHVCMKEAEINLSSKIESLSFHQQLLKEQFTNSCMNVSNLTDFYSKVQELETGIARISSDVQQMEIKQNSMTGKLQQDILSLLQEREANDKVREQVLNKTQASKAAKKNVKDLKSLESTCKIAINESLKNFEKQIVTIKDELRREYGSSTLNIKVDEFLRMNSEVQYLGQQVDFPVLPVYLNMTGVGEYNVSKSSWLSAPFYTHQEGYRMRLVVYPNGKYSGAGTHVSVAVYLMSGKYDRKLDWPLNMTLNITLLNQDSEDEDPISQLFDCSTSVYSIKCLDRVWDSTMANTGMIHSRFVAHHLVVSTQANSHLRSYIKHDSLNFRVDKIGHEDKVKRSGKKNKQTDYKRSYKP